METTRTVKSYEALIDGHFSISKDNEGEISLAIGPCSEPDQRIMVQHDDLEPIINCLKKAKKKWKQSYDY